jgi:hypothetical protein|tara:strand:- start:10604 stop:10795 length:192 start_codon:yes stop_codon:yes gene_type:complete
MNFQNLLSISQLVKFNPALSESMIRWWIFNAKANGFHKCLIKIGGRIFVDRSAFEQWLEEQRQ